MSPTIGRIPLTGPRPLLVVLAVLLVAAGVTYLVRRHRIRRRVGVVVSGVALVAVAAVAINTGTGGYRNVFALTGQSRFPRVSALPKPAKSSTATATPTVTPTAGPNGTVATPVEPAGPVDPQGEVATMDVPDTASHFGAFEAYVYLPPQYFTDTDRRFPVVVLTHGNPGSSSDWLDDGSAAETGLAVAQSGHPVILVMPPVLQHPDGDSLCVDTASEGNAETYVVSDVVAAADDQLRTIPDAVHRAIGGFSMGGFCALNLGLKHPDVFSVVLDFSGLTVCEPDAIEGGNEELFGTSNWRQLVADNSPAEYYQNLDPAKGPALWIDAGDEEDLAAADQRFATRLRAQGFTVEYHERPGDHGFATWTAALQESLPWAMTRMAS